MVSSVEQNEYEFKVIEDYFVILKDGLYCDLCQNYGAELRSDAVKHWETVHRYY